MSGLFPKIEHKTSGSANIKFSLNFGSSDVRTKKEMDDFLMKKFAQMAREFELNNPGFIFVYYGVDSEVRKPFERIKPTDPDYIGSKQEKFDYDAPYENHGETQEQSELNDDE